MPSARLFLFSVFLVLTIGIQIAQADTVKLSNGDKLSGEILSMADGKLKLKTTYAGVLSINWSDVASLDSEKDMAVYAKDTSVEKQPTEQARAVGEGTSVPVASIKAINAEPKRYELQGSVKAGWDKSSGNTRKENVNAAFDVTYRLDKNRWKGHGDYYWGASQGVRSDYNWMLSADYSRFLDEKIYLSGNGSIKQDEFQDLSLRSVLGTGVGYMFFDTDTLNLSAEAGPAYVWEKYSSYEDKEYLAGRWNLDFGWWAFPKRLKLFHWQNGVVSAENSENWIWQSKTGVLFPIVKRFFGTLQYNYDWNNSPVPGKQRDDSRILFSLGYSFSDFPWEWD